MTIKNIRLQLFSNKIIFYPLQYYTCNILFFIHLFLRNLFFYLLFISVHTTVLCAKDSNFTISQKKQFALPPDLILSLLNVIGAKAIIEQPFFLRTNSLNNRPVQDYPLFNDIRTAKRRDISFSWSFDSHSFFASTTHCLLNRRDDTLQSYLALEDKTVISGLRNSFEQITQLSNVDNKPFFDPERVLNALKNTHIEQRKAGFLFLLAGRMGECSVCLDVPVYYFERNFQLPQKNKDALEKEFGTVSPQAQEEFKEKHLISDKIGIGDLRLNVAIPITESWKDHFELQLFTTIPTNLTFKKGILGSHFKSSSTIPTLDVQSLLDMVVDGNQQEAFTLLSNLGLDALDRLAATLLESSIGNSRHVGIGVGILNKIKLIDLLKWRRLKYWHWNYTASLEYLVPYKEHRSFINKIDYETIENLNLVDPIDAQTTLDTFTQEALDRFFLRSFRALVHPGCFIRSYSSFVYHHKKWRFWLGSDFWFQSGETVDWISTDSNTKKTLDQHKVIKPYNLALSSLIGFSYCHVQGTYSIDIGLTGYSSYLTRGIGKESGIALLITTHF